MDRQGELGVERVEDLVGWAARDRFGGRIEFRGRVSAALYFSSGFLAHAECDASSSVVAGEASKEVVREHLVAVLADVLRIEDGTYVVVESAVLPDAARWLYGPLAILDAAMSQRDRLSEHRWDGVQVGLAPRDEAPTTTLSFRAWQVVVAMSQPADAARLSAALGWDLPAVHQTLDEMERLGLAVAWRHVDSIPGSSAAPVNSPAAPVSISPAPTVASVPGLPVASMLDRSVASEPAGSLNLRESAFTPRVRSDGEVSAPAVRPTPLPVPAPNPGRAPSVDAGPAAAPPDLRSDDVQPSGDTDRVRVSALRRLIHSLR